MVVGSGKVAQSLLRAFRSAGYLVRHWHRQSQKTIAALAVGVEYTFVAVPEYAWSSLANQLKDTSPVTVSGSMTKRDFRSLGLESVEVFHPLMTFAGPMSLVGAPIAVSSPRLATYARAIGAKPFKVARDRTLYHAAAVVSAAGILTTARLAAELLQASGVKDLRVLAPIMHRALDNALTLGAAGLTGPVARGDEATIKAHERAIRASTTGALQLYRALVVGMRRMAKRG